MSRFQKQVMERIQTCESVLCVGLDSVPERIPEIFASELDPQLAFNKVIIDATYDLTCCYKPNLAFYAVRGAEGIKTLKETIDYAHTKNVPSILDAKFGDIGHTASYYARFAFEELDADAVTLNPYMGEESIAPFRHYEDRTSFILCLTSNMSRQDFQTRLLTEAGTPEIPLFQYVAKKIVQWNHHDNLGAVVGATAPEELAELRTIFGSSIPILSPGVGAQGGDLEEVLWAGYTDDGGLFVNASRAILFASKGSDVAQSARSEAAMFTDQIRTFLSQYREDK